MSLFPHQQQVLEKKVANAYTFPAEFEKQESVWLSWPSAEPAMWEAVKGRPFYPVILDMIAALLPVARVSVIVNHESDKQGIQSALLQRCEGLLSQEALNENLQFHLVKHLSIWIRDFGPIFLLPSPAPRGAPSSGPPPLKVAVFRWNVWGYADQLRSVLPPEELAELLAEGEVARQVARSLALPTIDIDFVSEGGDREFNGCGTLMVTEAVQLQRNPHLTREQLDERYKALFDVRKVIWLKCGLAEDDHIFDGPLPGGVFTLQCTGGHIDEVPADGSSHTYLHLLTLSFFSSSVVCSIRQPNDHPSCGGPTVSLLVSYLCTLVSLCQLRSQRRTGTTP